METEELMDNDTGMRKSGIRYAVAAFGAWGILPLYWKMLNHVSAGQILAHRIFWSFIFVSGLLFLFRRWKEVWEVFKDTKKLFMVATSSLLISANWFLYIWAVNSNHLVETSLGYYINPLLSVLLGVVVLRERLNFWQLVSLVLAASGVTVITIGYGQVPWMAISIAGTFGLYGLAKKVTKLDSLIALALETMLVAPLALSYLAYMEFQGGSQIGELTLTTILLLAGAGIVTAMPLLWFAQATSRVPLSTVGFIQYLSPTITLFIGVVIFREPFDHTQLLSFALIWVALGLYSVAHHPLLMRLQPKFIQKSIQPGSDQGNVDAI